MAHNNLVVVFDACVLYPANLRDFLIYLSLFDLFQAKWTDEIHKEWMENLILNRPDIKIEKVQRTKNLMELAIPDASISALRYSDLLESITLPDKDDRHVLAAAIVCQAQMIVTFNLKDFPNKILEKYEISSIHPDDFIYHLITTSPEDVIDAFHKQVKSLKNPQISVQNLIKIHKKGGLNKSMLMIESLLGSTL